MKRGVSRFSVKNFWSHSAKKFRWETLQCIRKIRVAKNFMHKKGEKIYVFGKNSGVEKFRAKEGGSFTVLSRIFLPHRTKKTSPGNHSVFQNFSGKEKDFMNKRGRYHDFPSKFLSHRTEKFHWRTLWCFRKILLSKIFKHKREGGASRFCRNFLSHMTQTKNFVKEPFCFLKFFWYGKKFVDKRGLITNFSRNFFVSQCQKLS